MMYDARFLGGNNKKTKKLMNYVPEVMVFQLL